MNLIKNLRIIWPLLFLVSCSSAPFVESTDVCSLKRHHQDDLYQIRLNGMPINKHWYLKDDALKIAQDLASKEKNKCSPKNAGIVE